MLFQIANRPVAVIYRRIILFSRFNDVILHRQQVALKITTIKSINNNGLRFVVSPHLFRHISPRRDAVMRYGLVSLLGRRGVDAT